MRKFAFIVTLLFLSISVLAQSSPQMVSEVNVSTPKPGMTAQWEAGRKAHSAFHAAQKDTWSIFVWETLTGEHSGSYVMASPGHNWKDFDPARPSTSSTPPTWKKTWPPTPLGEEPPTTSIATISA